MAGLIGRWVGSEGVDVVPESDGDELNPYYETIVYEVVDDVVDVVNAEEQSLAAVRYQQTVNRKGDNKLIRSQVGVLV